MLPKILYRLVFVCFGVVVSDAVAAPANPTADEIMTKNFYVAKVKALTSDATMLLVNEKGQQRERKITTLSRLQSDGANVDLAIRFDLPADVRGTKFLQIQHAERDDDMWIYLPALKRSRRLVSNNKRDSFVGSDFSYADILPLRPSMFRHALSRVESFNGHDCYVVESLPQDDGLKRDLGYARRVSWIRDDNFVELKVDYYDLSGKLARTQNTANHKLVEADPPRWLALRREMVDYQTGHKTTITIDSVDTRTPVPARSFTVESIETN